MLVTTIISIRCVARIMNFVHFSKFTTLNALYYNLIIICLQSQVNDDTVIVTPNWPPKLIAALASNPSIPNFGVTGPSDTNNDKIFTHSFVHRTHIEVSNINILYFMFSIIILIVTEYVGFRTFVSSILPQLVVR